MKNTQFLQQWGRVPVSFQSYYDFHFRGYHAGAEILVRVFDSAEDMYRLQLNPGQGYLVKDLPILSATITQPNGERIQIENCW
jgi:hypothetical protein